MILTRGSFVPKHLETFLIVTARVVLQMNSGQRPEVMLNIPQFIGQSPEYTKNVNSAEVKELCFLR